MDVPFVANLLLLHNKIQAVINYNLRRENQCFYNYDYKQLQQVLEVLSKPTKLGQRTRGPFVIKQVHANGTLNIHRGPLFIFRVNIRHV